MSQPTFTGPDSLRDLIVRLSEYVKREAGAGEYVSPDTALQLASAVLELDRWLTDTGGWLPEPWRAAGGVKPPF